MNEFQTINDVVAESVRSSSYVTVVISSCVFIIYTLIIRLIDFFKAKNKSKPLYQMAAAIKENTANIVKLNQVLDKLFKDAETKENSRINFIITTSFSSFKSAILDQCIDIITFNNIDANSDNVKQTIYKTVSTEYYKIYSIFALYEHCGINLASKIKEEWIDVVTNECFQIIFNRCPDSERIRQLNRRLSIDTDQYAVYINNKIFNS